MIRPMKELIIGRASEIIIKADLEAKLDKGPLRIKFGIDPTGPILHLGRSSTIRRLRNLQDMGHQIVLIVGDFTAKIGDASDKTSERQVLSDEQIHANMTDYKRQLSIILDMDRVEFHHNSEWLGKLSPSDFIKLAQQFTVAQMLERENYSIRFKEGRPIGIHEFLYPLLQGYDSIAVNADVEVGGTDQLFNLMAGRTLQKQAGLTPQNVITFDLLTGTDGRKMSTSWGNTVYITDEPGDMFGKIMSINDEQIAEYYRICTDVELSVIEQVVADIGAGANPRDTKASLAREIVRIYHGEGAALAAEEEFNRKFRDKKIGKQDHEQIKHKGTLSGPVHEALVVLGMTDSKGEGRRLIEQGGVRLNGKPVVSDQSHSFKTGDVVQIGKRRIYELHLTTK
jgi:tyrosyl-tRNA synthetase